ncbi:DUF817 domain-containing protein [Vannielia litorea]|nr:DUF817 domain-containing protein [Vannielia litorea]MBY6075472.1 DUF817 domain-containing protein [Vannielia litorea]
MGDWARRRLPGWLADLVMFTLKQGWAALFGGLLLVAILATKAVWQPTWALARYDFLVLFALSTQVLFLWARLETWEEAKVIALFHLTGTAMEFFKVQAGSWSYPEAGVLKIMGVPMFSGFMYASIGSYIARVARIFEMRFAPYPPFWMTVLLACAIYVNFFAHHFLPDIRLALFAATLILYARTRVWFYVGTRPLWMPLPLTAFLVALMVWVAENIGTVTGTWAYPGQHWTQMVSFSKMGSWYLLLFVAFVTVTLVMRDFLYREAQRPPRRDLPHAGEELRA